MKSVLTITIMLLAASCNGKPKDPNIILIMVDTLRADHLSCYRAETVETPGIDAVASEGFLFTNVHAAATTTLASTSSLMTSLYPRSHGAASNGFHLDGSVRTLAEELRSKGYNTAAFVASFALHSSTGINQGFTYFDDRFSKTDQSPLVYRPAGDVNSAVHNWLATDPEEPVFLFVHYFDPHPPYTPPADLQKPVDDDAAAQITGSWDDLIALKNYLADGGEVDARLERMHDLYEAEVRYTDREFGRLIDLLGRKGLLEHSLLIITADHGETFWEHPEMGEYLDHGFMVYETTTNIPLIMKWPGVIPHGRGDTFLSNIDIAPTILELTGKPVPEGFSGRSFARLFREDGIADEPVFSEATKPHGEIESAGVFANDLKAKCVYLDGWKYIWVPHMDNHEELYDIRNDPTEMINALEDSGSVETAEKMRTMLRRWSLDVSDIARNRQYEVDEETREKLKALGYTR